MLPLRATNPCLRTSNRTPRHWPDDFLQAHALKTWKERKSFAFDVGQAWKRWASVLLANEIVNAYRQMDGPWIVDENGASRRKQAERLPEPKADWEPSDRSASAPDHQVIREELAAWMRACFLKLPSLECLMLRLFYFEALKVEEISTILDIPVGTVGTTMRRARMKLRECLLRGNFDRGDV